MGPDQLEPPENDELEEKFKDAKRKNNQEDPQVGKKVEPENEETSGSRKPQEDKKVEPGKEETSGSGEPQEVKKVEPEREETGGSREPQENKKVEFGKGETTRSGDSYTDQPREEDVAASLNTKDVEPSNSHD